jgi:hypothetical protein
MSPPSLGVFSDLVKDGEIQDTKGLAPLYVTPNRTKVPQLFGRQNKLSEENI